MILSGQQEARRRRMRDLLIEYDVTMWKLDITGSRAMMESQDGYGWYLRDIFMLRDTYWSCCEP